MDNKTLETVENLKKILHPDTVTGFSNKQIIIAITGIIFAVALVLWTFNEKMSNYKAEIAEIKVELKSAQKDIVQNKIDIKERRVLSEKMLNVYKK